MIHLKIAIVDDDAQDTDRLAAFLAEWSEEHHLDFSVTVFHKSSDFLKAFETARYSLVFMDIYMGPPSGIETAMKLREKDSHALLIFLTSSQEHMSDAFRCHAFDYLVKPFDLEQMKKTILDALAFLPEKEQYLNLSVRKQNVPIFTPISAMFWPAPTTAWSIQRKNTAAVRPFPSFRNSWKMTAVFWSSTAASW